MSHYQAYLKAVGTQDPKRTTSSPLPNSIPRKPATHSTMPNTAPTTSSPLSSKPSSAAPSIRSLRQNTTYPTPAAEFAAAAKQTALAAHPPPPRSPSAIKAPEPTIAAAPSSSPTHRLQSQHNISHQQQNTTTQTQTQPSTSQPYLTNNPHSTLTPTQLSQSLQHTLSLLSTATFHHAKYPASALLLAPDNSSILLSHFSLSRVKHATSELARLAAEHFSPEYLASCTVVCTWEPCVMCAGTVFWSGIGRVIYAAGADGQEGVAIPCRIILCSSSREVEVTGPVAEWEEKIREVAGPWFAEHGGRDTGPGMRALRANGLVNGVGGSGKQGNGVYGHGETDSASAGVATTWTAEENVLSSIGEDGEYKAELNIDWMR